MLLHSNIIGDGTPFIILHGFFGMGDNWKTLGKRFSDPGNTGRDGFQVHLIDLRNHGRSFHSDDFNYNLMVEDLNEYCNYYKIEKFVLLGHSMGGKTAMFFAGTYQEKVSKLIVADIAPKEYPQHHQDILKALSVLDFSEIKTRKEADEALSVDIINLGVRQFLLKNIYWKEKGELALRMNLPVLIKHNEEIGKSLSEELIYNGDTLFLRGSESGYIVAGDEILIRKHFPKAIIETISNAGHWLHSENPTEFYQYVMNFLSL
ncbi:MAG: alpha/beta fold hydrolase [Bacteroidetes bacterium]|nr:alpha/beta fold hydrolase [Bacteroidota bacterium]